MRKFANMRYGLLFLLLGITCFCSGQARFSQLPQLKLDSGIILTFDEPNSILSNRPTKIVIYALPNGNTTAQTYGKRLIPGDDWHFDIQHIGAQTTFIRNTDPKTNYIVVYCENTLKSWPAWRRKFTNADLEIGKIVDLVFQRYHTLKPKLTLSGHSGGGSFIFGYINGQVEIPKMIERIGFLDATYGYETGLHLKKINKWLGNKTNSLQVFAYNDSVVVYNGKPLVSPTGGTWYRSQLMARDLTVSFQLTKQDLIDRINFQDSRGRIAFKLIKNPEAKIYHTVLVERNGFVEILFAATKFHNRNYLFWGDRAYQAYILAEDGN